MIAIDFSDDPRAALIHFNEKHDSLGRFAKKSGGGTSSTSATEAKFTNKNSLGYDQHVVDHAQNIIKTYQNVMSKASASDRPKYATAVAKNIVDSMLDGKTFKNNRRLMAMGNSAGVPGESGKYWYSRDEYMETADHAIKQIMVDITAGLGVDSGSVAEKIRPYVEMYTRQQFEKRYEESVENQRKERLQGREKEVSGSASVKRRAMNAEQAYKLASEQRHKDIQKKQEADGAANAYAKASEQRRKDLEKKLKHVDYTDDPRAVLIHFNKNHDPKTGQFTTSVGLGIGKYIDSKGNLTEEGERRLAHDKKRNAQKKKDDQVKAKDGMTVDEILTDPHRWVKEDLNEIESGLKAAGALTGDVSKFLKSREANRPLVRKKRLKLKDMTDAELQAQINRYMLEQRYEDIFNPKEPPEVSKGKKFLMNTLEVTGSVLAVGASAVTIAKALHELKKGS